MTAHRLKTYTHVDLRFHHLTSKPADVYFIYRAGHWQLGSFLKNSELFNGYFHGTGWGGIAEIKYLPACRKKESICGMGRRAEIDKKCFEKDKIEIIYRKS